MRVNELLDTVLGKYWDHAMLMDLEALELWRAFSLHE